MARTRRKDQGARSAAQRAAADQARATRREGRRREVERRTAAWQDRMDRFGDPSLRDRTGRSRASRSRETVDQYRRRASRMEEARHG